MIAAIFCGSRDASDMFLADEIMLTWYHTASALPHFAIIGGARGADAMFSTQARYHGIPHQEMAAAWNEWGRAAGPIRNQDMLARLLELRGQGYTVSVIALVVGNCSVTAGTADMVRRAVAAGVTVHVHYEDGGTTTFEALL